MLLSKLALGDLRVRTREEKKKSVRGPVYVGALSHGKQQKEKELVGLRVPSEVSVRRGKRLQSQGSA